MDLQKVRRGKAGEIVFVLLWADFSAFHYATKSQKHKENTKVRKASYQIKPDS